MLVNSLLASSHDKILNKFDQNLRFTVDRDRFQNKVLHFLCLELLPSVSQLQNNVKKLDKNLCFTVDIFQNEVIHLLDFELSPNISQVHTVFKNLRRTSTY